MWNQKIRVIVFESALSSMTSHANSAFPDEAGGVLMGHWDDRQTTVVVTNAIGPGPNATHNGASFIPDYTFQEAEIARIYRDSGRTNVYLGDWHSHPNGPSSLSGRDKQTMRNIANFAAARMTTPIMLLLSGTEENWITEGWRLKKCHLQRVILSILKATT